MSIHRWHFWEKLQVELAALGCFLLGYFLLGPLLRPTGPSRAMVFLPLLDSEGASALGRLLLLAAGVWALAALAALATLASRPEGALVGAMAGVVGLSLRSGPMQELLMRFEDRVARLMLSLAGELVSLAGVAVGAMAVVLLVRALMRRARPRWVRPRELPSSEDVPGKAQSTALPDQSPAQKIGTLLATFALTAVVAVLLLAMLLFSTDRGQIIFAVALSLFIAAAVAQYFFPSHFSAACWLAPVAMGLFVYLRASLWPPQPGPLIWLRIMEARWTGVLPIDWLGAGVGGAAAGYWLACRLREANLLAKPAEPAEE